LLVKINKLYRFDKHESKIYNEIVTCEGSFPADAGLCPLKEIFDSQKAIESALRIRKQRWVMKNTKTESKRSAEDWVTVAREFGEKCQAIQHDSKLDIDQKLEKQKELCKEMGKEIESDANLKSEEKKMMLASITNYMDEWMKMHDLMKSAAASAKEKKGP